MADATHATVATTLMCTTWGMFLPPGYYLIDQRHSGLIGYMSLSCFIKQHVTKAFTLIIVTYATQPCYLRFCLRQTRCSSQSLLLTVTFVVLILVLISNSMVLHITDGWAASLE